MKKFAIAASIQGKDIKALREYFKLTQAEFSALVNVSQKTIERWESNETAIHGPIVTLVKILNEYKQIPDDFTIPEQTYPMRLWYMFRDEVCTIIDVDESARRLTIYNYTHSPLKRAFGKKEKPTFDEYEQFLESRCFPRTRDKMKLILKDLGLPFYDPLMIIEKTKGRMAEDDFWIKIER